MGVDPEMLSWYVRAVCGSSGAGEEAIVAEVGPPGDSGDDSLPSDPPIGDAGNGR